MNDYGYFPSLTAAEEAEEIASARNVVLRIGPRGGFHHLSYQYTPPDCPRADVGIGGKAKPLIEHKLECFRQRGLSVRVEREP